MAEFYDPVKEIKTYRPDPHMDSNNRFEIALDRINGAYDGRSQGKCFVDHEYLKKFISNIYPHLINQRNLKNYSRKFDFIDRSKLKREHRNTAMFISEIIQPTVEKLLYKSCPNLARVKGIHQESLIKPLEIQNRVIRRNKQNNRNSLYMTEGERVILRETRKSYIII